MAGDKPYVLSSVAMVTADNGWAVGGAFDTSIILHWDGSEWSQVASPSPLSVEAVDMVSADDGWALGLQGAILHYSGANAGHARSYLPIIQHAQ